MLEEQSWGVQLWDQTSNLLKYQETNICLHERLQKFLTDIAKLQKDSFMIQKKFCKKSIINIKKIVGIETTFGVGFNAFIQAISKLIDTENLMAYSFEIQATAQTKQAIEEERKRFQHWKQERDRFQSEIKSQTKIIDEENKRYNEKYRDALRSKEDYERIDEDKTYSKLEVEKALNLYSLRHCEFKRAREDYAAALAQFNIYRKQYYTKTLRTWGEVGQMIEAFRIAKTQELIGVLLERLRVTIDRMNAVCVDLESAASLIDADKDAMTLIERLKTGNIPPDDIPLIQLSIIEPPEVKLDIAGAPVVHRNFSLGDVQHYASIPVGLVSSNSPTFSGPYFPSPDALIEPTELHKLSTPALVAGPSGGVGRRFSTNSNAATANGHSFIWKMFLKRSKRQDSIDDVFQKPTRYNSVIFDSIKPWRRSRRSKSISSFWRTESHKEQRYEADSIVPEPKLFEATSLGNLSREVEKQGQCGDSNARQGKIGRSLSTREMPYRSLEIIHVDHERGKLKENRNCSDIKSNPPGGVPDLSPTIESSVTKALLPHESIQNLSQFDQNGSDRIYGIPSSTKVSTPELASSEKVYSSIDKAKLAKQEEYNNNGYSHKHQTKPDRPPPITMPGADISPRHSASNTRSIERHAATSRYPSTSQAAVSSLKSKSGSQTSPNSRHREAEIGRESQYLTPWNPNSVRQTLHQPKRHNPQTCRQTTTHSSRSNKSSSKDDLLIIGTGTALYDFDSVEYGPTFLSFQTGDVLNLLSSSHRWPGPPDSDGWAYAELASDEAQKGFIPSAFIEKTIYSEPIHLHRNPSHSNQNIDQTSTNCEPLHNSTNHSPYQDPSNYRRNGHRLNRGTELMALGQATDI